MKVSLKMRKRERRKKNNLPPEEEGYEIVEEYHPTLETGKFALLSCVPRSHTLRVKGNIQGQKVMTLVDGGATHNFIDETL